MPVRNSEKTVKMAISSTLIGMRAFDQLVIVNDASQDSTPSILASYEGDARVTIIHNSRQLGVAASLNAGLAIASGDIIARMDSDDISLPWRTHRALRAFSSRNVDFVFSTAVLFGAGLSIPLPQPPLKMDSKSIRSELAWGNPLVHPTMYARREPLAALGGYRDCLAEDLDLWIRAVSHGYQFWRDPIWGILYRIHPNQTTQSSSWIERSDVSPEAKLAREGFEFSGRKPFARKLISALGQALLALFRRR